MGEPGGVVRLRRRVGGRHECTRHAAPGRRGQRRRWLAARRRDVKRCSESYLKRRDKCAWRISVRILISESARIDIFHLPHFVLFFKKKKIPPKKKKKKKKKKKS